METNTICLVWKKRVTVQREDVLWSPGLPLKMWRGHCGCGASGFDPLLLWGKCGDQRPIGMPRTQTLWQRVPRDPEQPKPINLELGSPDCVHGKRSSEPSQPTSKNKNYPVSQVLAVGL